jgi:SsrA-binding protein
MKLNLINKKAKFDYKLLDKYEAGIELMGREVKYIRAGKVDLSRSYVKEIGGQLYLINANIGEDSRSRRLLMHKKEILSLILQKKAKKLTYIPIRLYNKQRLIKLEFASAKPKREHQKKETVKKRDIERDIERELKLN